jgi:phosphate transport system substrate-binding protein
MLRYRTGVLVLAAGMGLSACGGGEGGAEGGAAGELSGTISADGSSTVFPITEAVAEEFMAETGGGVRVTVASSGTGGGFQRFCAGEIDVSNASRAIEPEELEACRAAGIDPVELSIGMDGEVIVLNPANTFVQCLTTAELKRVWEPSSTVRTWADIRPEWPAEPIKLYGPGTNSGSFDFFTETIMGEADASRADYTASEDDNVLVQGVAGDAQALGYFGFAYYSQNTDKLKVAAVDGGQGCVAPSVETIDNGTYQPLSRPLFIYVKKASLQRREVADFLRFILDNETEISQAARFVPLTNEQLAETRKKLDEAIG